MPARVYGEGANPSGLRLCGCGRKTPIAKASDRKTGDVLGTPMRFVKGHKPRPIEYVEQDCGYETPCWVWQRGIGTHGYGLSTYNDKPELAHRRYYMTYVGPIPDGHELDHLCRNPKCVNPVHLEAVTRVENTRRGTATKLTAAEVAEIRRRRAAGERNVDLAREFGVSAGYVSTLTIGRSVWKEVW